MLKLDLIEINPLNQLYLLGIQNPEQLITNGVIFASGSIVLYLYQFYQIPYKAPILGEPSRFGYSLDTIPHEELENKFQNSLIENIKVTYEGSYGQKL